MTYTMKVYINDVVQWVVSNLLEESEGTVLLKPEKLILRDRKYRKPRNFFEEICSEWVFLYKDMAVFSVNPAAKDDVMKIEVIPE